MDTPAPSPLRSLRQRVMSGGIWTLGGFGANNVIRLASNLILTRLLMPEAFGLMALATAFHVWIGQMTDLGINASVIRSKNGTDPKFLATAWTLQIARNTSIAAILLLMTLILSILRERGVFVEGSVYADPRLNFFMWMICLSLFINGFKSMRAPIAHRDLAMPRLTILAIFSQVISVGATIWFAANDFGVYSLVYGMVIGAVAGTSGSYFILKGPPSRLGFDREHFREIFSYGKWLLVASFFGFLVNRGDQVLLGLYFEKGEFGFYAIAGIWVGVAAAVVNTVQQRVGYPAFSEIHRDRPKDLTRIYYKMKMLTDAGCFAVFLGMFVFAETLVDIVYTDEYSRVAYYVRLLAITILFIPYRLLNTAILSSGDSRRFTIITVAPGLALFTLMPVIYHFYGAEPAIIFATMIQIFSIPFSWRYAARVIELDPLRESMMVIAAIIAATAILAT